MPNTYIPGSLLNKGEHMTYPAFAKIPRWNREVVLTEKLDGTNGLVAVIPPVNIDTAKVYEADDGKTWPPRNVELFQGRTRPPLGKMLPDGTEIAAGSRKRWLNPNSDHFGFAQWVWDHAEDLAQLGPGFHYGEWYGKGINRGYGLADRRFALFNVARWEDGNTDYKRPDCCETVTVLTRCEAAELGEMIQFWAAMLTTEGSAHVPGYPRPEGIVLYHTAGNNLYKVTFEGDRAKTADGYVIRPAGAEWLGLGRGLREAVTSPDDAAAMAREAVQHWTNKEFQPNPVGVGKFETELAAAA